MKDAQQFFSAMPGRRNRIGAGPLDIVDRTPCFLGRTTILVAKCSCRAPEVFCDIVQLHGDSPKAASCLRNRRLHELLPQALVNGCGDYLRANAGRDTFWKLLEPLI